MNNKGQAEVNSLFPIVTTLIIVGVLFGAGVMILGQMEEAGWTSKTVAVANETLTTVNEAGETLVASTLAGRGDTCAITRCANSTNNVIIPAGNYTVTNCNIKFSHFIDATGVNGTNWKCTYSYTYNADSNASVGTRDVANATTDLATTWIPVIVVVIAAGIVLGILLGAFSGGKKK